MANEKSNYGVSLKKDSTLIGEITNLDFPEIMNPAVEITNHNSGGYKEFVPGGVVEVGEFKATLNLVTISGVLTDVVNGTVHTYEIDFPDTTTTIWSFQAYTTSFKPLSADAQKPEAQKAEVTFRPTGTVTIS